MKVKSLRITGRFQYQQLGEILLEGKTIGGDGIMKLRVPLQIGPGTLDRILHGIANSLNGAFLIIEDYSAHAK